VSIAQQEQELGNYKYAHDVLLDTFKEIKASKLRIPFELNNKLMLIHSYQLGKKLVKLGNHLGAARLLVRVCQNISQFPQNSTNILTSCVGECSQSNLKQQAYIWSCMLVRPEHVDNIPSKYKTKIEGIARRPVKQEDDPEPLAPCPFCKFEIPESRLDCPSCKHNLPFCSASGKHMVLSEWSSCPKCMMCCNYNELKRYLESEQQCPMCEANVSPMDIMIADDPASEFKMMMSLMKDSGKHPDEESKDDEDDESDIHGHL